MAEDISKLKAQVSQLRDRWVALSATVRWTGIALLSTLIAAGVFFASRSPEGKYEVLYSGLSQDDAARIVPRLKDMRILYKLESGGQAILVPEKDVHETRLALASEGLPSGGGIGFEIFDEQRFGESEFSEKVKYHRALEGELSRTISHLEGVKSSRVHLVLPMRSLFEEESDRASASVVLRLVPGWKMRDDQVRGIVNLVASSVRGLDTERVTLVDGQGRRLAKGDSQEEVASDSLRFRQEFEHEKEKAIQKLLDTTLGSGKAMVRVSADLNFAQEERTEERFDPEAVAVRSYQLEQEKEEGAVVGEAAGVPGSETNLQGAPVVDATANQEGVLRHSETRNFEVSKVVKHAVEPVGRLERLQVAVVVDGHWKTQKNGERVFKARGEKELESLEAIVASAVGVQEERGDRVTVTCVPFDASAHPPEKLAEPPIWRELIVSKDVWTGAAGVLALLIVLVFAFRFKRAPSATPHVPLKVQQTEKARLPGGEDSKEEGQDLQEIKKLLEPIDESGPAEIRKMVSELVGRDPELAARVIRLWIVDPAGVANG